MSSRSGPPEPVRVVFRYDDCSAKSSLELERGFVDAFARCGAQVSMGVIPFVCEDSFHDAASEGERPLTGGKARWLRDVAAAGHAEIALHGLTHRTLAPGRRSEFAGVDPAEQARRIEVGKAELERVTGASVTSFIPPWNAYDVHTVRALEAHGFTCLSASVRGPFEFRTRMGLLPFTTWMQGLDSLIGIVRHVRAARPVLVVMMHDFDFFESGSPDAWLSIEEFGRRVREVARQPDVRLLSLGQAVAEGVAAAPEQLGPYRAWRARVQRLPWRVRRALEDQVLWASSGRLSHLSAAVWARQSAVSAQRLWADLLPSVRKRIDAFTA